MDYLLCTTLINTPVCSDPAAHFFMRKISNMEYYQTHHSKKGENWLKNKRGGKTEKRRDKT